MVYYFTRNQYIRKPNSWSRDGALRERLSSIFLLVLLLDEPPVVSALGNGLEGDVNRHYNNHCGDEEQPIETEGH